MTLEQKFLEEISRCKDPVIFLGLSRVLLSCSCDNYFLSANYVPSTALDLGI